MMVTQRTDLFVLAFAILLPGGDPCLRCLLVDARRQARHPHGTNQPIVDRQGQPTGNKIDLAGIHVHDAVESVGSRCQQLGYRRVGCRAMTAAKALPVAWRSEVPSIRSTETRCPPSSSTATDIRIFKFRA